MDDGDDFDDPQVTLDALDGLEQFNMTQEQFEILHHLGETSTNLSIGGHRTYCKRILNGATKRFAPGGGNAATAERLTICLQALKAGYSWDDALDAARTKSLVAVPVFAPTADDDELESAVSELISLPLPKQPPAGRVAPRATSASGSKFERDPHVAAWVLRRADGHCEHCAAPAPFTRADGRPFLEIHHVVRLADGGSDRVSNTTALCPNCHRLFHHSPNARDARQRLYARVSELMPENAPASGLLR